MDDGNFYGALRSRFGGRKDAAMLTTPRDRGLTYGEMDARSAQMAGAFLSAGARPGDRVLVQVEKSAENIAAYLGAMRAGLVYVPLNTAYTDEEVAYFLGDAEPSIFVCDPDREDALAALAEKAGVNGVLTLDNADAGSLSRAADDASGTDVIQPRHHDDLAAILYTSGTTGRSKGAMLSHGGLAANALALNRLWGFSANDILLHALPVFHIHGLFVALHTAMLSACEILFLPKFDIAEILGQMRRATVMMGVPTFYTRLLNEPEFGGKDATHMRLFSSGSAPLTEDTFAAFAERTGHRILERYGMSEAGMIASNPLNGERIAGTVGFALPGVELRVTNDNGAVLPATTPGHVEVKSDSLFKGYWRMPEKTKETFHDSWFVTGDVGALDKDGRLTLSGRAKDLIIAGGYNIYPKEVETVLDAVPGVVESAVVGAPHPDMGEGVVAVLVGDAQDDAVRYAVSSLAKFKRPRRLYWMDALPRNAMGKVQKQVLRERFANAFQGD
jgi:malonyl-CoA/methylmalonyl-CoA synthetase